MNEWYVGLFAVMVLVILMLFMIWYFIEIGLIDFRGSKGRYVKCIVKLCSSQEEQQRTKEKKETK